jgi:diguanylate cyclase
MLPEDVSTLIFICVWSLAAVTGGLVCGFFMGRFYTLSNESKKLKNDREETLTSLLKLMSSTDQLNVDVDEHNNALASAQQELETIQADDDCEDLHSTLLSNIARVVSSNRRLENDLVVSKYQLENQAQELDRTRLEARTDVLCGIGNRKAVDETLQFMISRYQSADQVTFGLMVIDVDHFKRVNDTFGHAAGDEVLSSIAIALKECVRPEDFVGRLGGDEFVVMLEGLTQENAELVGARIRSTIELYDFSINSNGQSTVVTLSMGLTVVNEDDTIESIYERADQALYKSKALGRNRLFTWNDESLDEMETRPETKDDQESLSSYESFKASFGDQLQGK